MAIRARPGVAASAGRKLITFSGHPPAYSKRRVPVDDQEVVPVLERLVVKATI